MFRFVVVMFVFSGCFSCKKQVSDKPGMSDNEANQIIKEFDDSLPDPPRKPVEEVGEVIFGADTFKVIEEETDKISMVSQFIYDDNGKDMVTTKYREKIFHLINKNTQDTITINKEIFREYNTNGDFAQLLLQSAVMDASSKQGNIPLMISLCKPDTDVCDNYGITIVNGKAVIEEVDLGEMAE
ncbi:hypothetical protein [Flavobacterium suzhouense]|uniref:DUF4738 domain-containing protein n=1 Tax=Flavobacterium suzhouense TaxID=1529638 RepID=A0ABW5NPX2_9FLAO